MSFIDRLLKRLKGAEAKDRSLRIFDSYQKERRHRERRGLILQSQSPTGTFIYQYWSRFYSDFPENDRRKLKDRRQLNPAQQF